MTAYQFLPPLSDAEYEALRADIAANGMRHPILVDERGKILDGHHRARIAAELGFKPDREVAEGLTEEEKRDVAFTLNSARRHMDPAAKRAAVTASLKADPHLSDRQHARRVGVSHPTVAGIRAELVAAGRLESLTSRVSADGRSRPATQPTSTPSGPSVPSASATDEDRTGPEPAEVGSSADGASAGAVEPALPGVTADAPTPVVSVGETDTTGNQLREFVNSDPDVQAAEFMKRFVGALHAGGNYLEFDVERVANLADPVVVESIQRRAELAARFAEQVSRARSGLRLVKGGMA